MNRLRRLAVGASMAALAAFGIGIEGASAKPPKLVVLKVLCTSGCAGSPFSFGPFGVGSIGVLEGILKVAKNTVYDWKFTILAPDVNMEMQAAAVMKKGSTTPEPIQFTLWSGTPTGSHALLDTSLYTIGATLSVKDLTTGAYFMQLAPSGVAKIGEQVDGSLSVSGVPEPASWMLMIGGLGLLGAGLRLRTRQGAFA